MKQKNKPFAKITRPNATGIFPRKRLFDVIDRSREFPVIFMISPPGSGKTSLVTSYLEKRKIPCLWFSVDKGDRDIATFFHYMHLAVQHLFSEDKIPLPRYTPDYEHGVAVFARRWFEAFFNKASIPFFLVFDNYQNIPMSSRFHEMLTHGFTVIPKGVNVVIASRKEPPPSFSKMYMYNEAQVIGWDTMKLTIDEVKSLVARKLPGGLDEGDIQSLYEKTAGWIAGLMLSLKRIGYKDVHYDKLSDRLSTRGVFD